MEFLKKAAAMAISVVAGLFGVSEAPESEPQVQPRVAYQAPDPVITVNAVQRPVLFVSDGQGKVSLVILREPVETPLDEASRSFLDMIHGRPSAKHPLSGALWYLRGGTPALDDATSLLRALVTGDGDF